MTILGYEKVTSSRKPAKRWNHHDSPEEFEPPMLLKSKEFGKCQVPFKVFAIRKNLDFGGSLFFGQTVISKFYPLPRVNLNRC